MDTGVADVLLSVVKILPKKERHWFDTVSGVRGRDYLSVRFWVVRELVKFTLFSDR